MKYKEGDYRKLLTPQKRSAFLTYLKYQKHMTTIQNELKLTGAVQVKTDGTITAVSPKNGKDFKLEELYQLTSSTMVELVNLRSNHPILELWCDEDGMMNNRAPNPVATMFIALDGIYTPPEGMLGDVLICKKGMFK